MFSSPFPPTLPGHLLRFFLPLFASKIQMRQISVFSNSESENSAFSSLAVF